MALDIRFIILGTILILCLIPLYIYRKEIYSKFIYEKSSLKLFLNNIENHLKLYYPKFKFNFDIINKLPEAEDSTRKEIQIIENIVNQFAKYDYELKTQKSVAKEMLWNTYTTNSKLIKDNKLPTDWAQRKEAAWNRDSKKCNRCGKEISLNSAQALLAKQMKNGGEFNLENIVILCSDCSRIIKSSNVEKIIKDLNIYDELLKRVID